MLISAPMTTTISQTTVPTATIPNTIKPPTAQLSSLMRELIAHDPTDDQGPMPVRRDADTSELPTIKSHTNPRANPVAAALSEVAQFDRNAGVTDTYPISAYGHDAANLCTFKFIHQGKAAPRHPYPIRRDIDTFGVPVQFTRAYPKGMQYDDMFDDRPPAGGARDHDAARAENLAAGEVYLIGATCMTEDIGLCHPVLRLNAQHAIDQTARGLYEKPHGVNAAALERAIMAGALVPHITDTQNRTYSLFDPSLMSQARANVANLHAPRFHCDGISIMNTGGTQLQVQLLLPRSTQRTAKEVVHHLPRLLASVCMGRLGRINQVGSVHDGKLPARADASIFGVLVELDADTAIMILVPGALLIDPDHAKAMGVILGHRLMLLLDMHPFCRALRTPMDALAPYADLLVAAKQLQDEGLALPTSWRWHDSISNMMGRKVVFAPCTPEAYAKYESVLQRRFGDTVAHQFSQMVARTVEVDYRDVRGVRYIIDDFSVAMLKLAAALPTLTHVPLLSGMDLPTHDTMPVNHVRVTTGLSPEQAGKEKAKGSGNWLRNKTPTPVSPEDGLTITIVEDQIAKGATLTSEIMYVAALAALLEVYRGEPIVTLAKRMPQSIALAARHGVTLNMRKLHMYYAKARESYVPTAQERVAINNVNNEKTV